MDEESNNSVTKFVVIIIRSSKSEKISPVLIGSLISNREPESVHISDIESLVAWSVALLNLSTGFGGENSEWVFGARVVFWFWWGCTGWFVVFTEVELR